MIPKIIHQTAKTRAVNPKWEPFQKITFRLHGDWTYRLWTDEDNINLLKERRPDLERVYFSMTQPAMRADLMRYIYMQQFGGLYYDLDYQFLKPFDLTDHALVLPAESDDGQPLYLGNCIFASVPGHPFWTALLDAIRETPPTKETVKSEDDSIAQAGPGKVTQVWHESFSHDGSIFVPPRLWFHPPVPETDAALNEVVSHKETYGIHWCFGTWRALTPWARLKNRLKKAMGR